MKKVSIVIGVYSVVFSIVVLVLSVMTYIDSFSEITADFTPRIDAVIRILFGVMLLMGILLLDKDKVSSMVGKIMIIIAAVIVVGFSTKYGFVAGIIGIIGSNLILTSSKRYEE